MAVTNEEGGGGGEPRITPKFSAINAMLKPGGEVEEAAKAQQEAMGKLGAAFKKIEKDFHGNRQAVGFIRKLDKMSKDKRDDLIRTLEPMLVERGYTLEVIDPEDLASQAQSGAPAAPGDDDDDDDGEGEDDQRDDAAPAEARTAPLPIADALSAARDRLSAPAAEPGAVAGGAQATRKVRMLVGALRAGQSLTEATLYAGMTAGEAQHHAEAERRGEYPDIAAITPSSKPARGKPKLGIVVGGNN